MGRSTSHCKIKPPNIWLSSLVIQESEINYHRGHYTTNQNNALLHNSDRGNTSRSDLETSQLYPNSLANWIKTTPVNGLQVFFPSIFRGPNIFRQKKQWNVPTYRSQFHLKFSGSLYPTSWTPHLSATDEGTPAPDWIDYRPSNRWIRWPDRIVSTWNIMHHTSSELFREEIDSLLTPVLGCFRVKNCSYWFLV